MFNTFRFAVPIDISAADQILPAACDAIYCGDATPHDLCVAFATKSAEVSLTINSSGVITAVTLISGGFGYLTAPTVTVVGGAETGAGANITCTVVSGKVATFTIVSGGTGYSAIRLPQVNFTGGQGTGTVLKNVPVGVLPVKVTKIFKTSTTAINLQALYV